MNSIANLRAQKPIYLSFILSSLGRCEGPWQVMTWPVCHVSVSPVSPGDLVTWWHWGPSLSPQLSSLSWLIQWRNITGTEVSIMGPPTHGHTGLRPGRTLRTPGPCKQTLTHPHTEVRWRWAESFLSIIQVFKRNFLSSPNSLWLFLLVYLF